MKSKHIVLLTVSLFCSVISFGQDLGTVIFGTKSKADYIGQYTDNHKIKNGLGIQRYRNGSVYIGDLSQNRLSGKGMLISEKGIANAKDAVVYVGSWKSGEKQGKGTCYASNGDIIYQGKFEDDHPVDVYPTLEPEMNNYFTMKDFDGELYWGEVTKGIPNGFGIIVQEDGFLEFGMFDNGQRIGIHMTIYGEDNWEVGKWEENNYTAFNNTEKVVSRRNDFVEARKTFNRQIRNDLWGVAQGLAEVGLQTIQIATNSHSTNTAMTDETNDATSVSSQNSSSRKSASTVSSKSNDCGTAWMSDSRSYSNFETTLIRDGGSLSASDIKDIKNKMKRIRQKWETRGCPFTKSPYE